MTTQEAAREPYVGSVRVRLAGFGVHVYTASGSVLALLIVVAAMDGEVIRALWLSLAALVIDGTDGMLARKLRVSETMPWFDGARLDDIVDYLTYAFAPIVLLWTGSFLPSGPAGPILAALPLLASSYQFCRTDAKTADHFFLGFPSYWNVVAFYVVVLELSPAVTGALLAVFSVLVFVPIRYIYPSRTKAFRSLNLLLTAIWLATYATLLVQMPDPSAIIIALSVAYVIYYAAASMYLTWISPRLPEKLLSKDAIAAELED
ncbi:MAG TPA: CDP-alcohol phosphatidyltransferase family protein [Nocardioidaceae bacterium]|nr:CDP-alcohol phosphatidyltransferase family protein [Nocardioidaceae bacterium]